MGQIKRHKPVKLFAGFIFKEEAAFLRAKSVLERRFGKADFESRAIPFEHTDYYQNEFGKDLKKKFLCFKRLISPTDLPRIKIYTNKIEKKISAGPCRLINIDPGYLTLAKVVLASTKDYCHRIYADRGIFLEITLHYENKSFRPYEWAYPDYQTQGYIEIFERIRELYAAQIKNI